MRTILVTNETTILSDAQVLAAVNAVQVQVSRDFAPAYGLNAHLNFKHGPPPVGVEAVRVVNSFQQADALGFHTEQVDVPYGFVSVEAALQNGSDWRGTLSHEVIEQLADPFVSLAVIVAAFNDGKVIGPAAAAYEIADPVEDDLYSINGVPVSNFVLPVWFSSDVSLPGTQFDYLRRLKGPFELTRGGYIAYTRDLKVWGEFFADESRQIGVEPRAGTRRHRRLTKGE